MIPTCRVRRRVWRILSPRWTHAPLSGEGAARFGGRWNRPGQPALYLSEQVETAFAEYQQELGTRPGTFVAYDLEAESIVDVTEPATLAQLGVDPGLAYSPWKTTALIDGGVPPTWALADRLVADHPGLRVPSVQYAGGANLVLWRWNMPGAASIEVLDPKGEMPGMSRER